MLEDTINKDSVMQNILFISHNVHQCGVYQFGKNTAELLKNSNKYKFCYVECSLENGAVELFSALIEYKPVAVIYNWHPETMPWLDDQLFKRMDSYMPFLKHVIISHGYHAAFSRIDAFISDDPDSQQDAHHFHIGRFIFDYTPKSTPADNVIGSFGFGLNHKGYSRLIEQVNQEFEEATIRLHMPAAFFADKDGKNANSIIQACKQLAKPGIRIEHSDCFFTSEELIDWLANNTINCFFFENATKYGNGISSSIDYALAAKRPIAITNASMFRHIVNAQPSILIEKSSLKQIIAQGIKPLEPFYQRWTKENLLTDYEGIMDTLLVSECNFTVNNECKTIPYNLTSNRVLTTEDRVQLLPVIEELKRLCPDMMQRKIPEAVFQNAFIYQQAKFYAKKSDDIIIIGGYEDPIGPALQALGYKVTITDPNIDGKDMRNVWIESIYSGVKYDMVVCCSVLEHVEEDATFIQEMYQILKPNGIALLTTDYRHDWMEGMPKPVVDRRLYTANRLKSLIEKLPVNSAIDEPCWDNTKPYFRFETADYCFCSLAFQRKVDDHTKAAEDVFIKNYLSQLFKDSLLLEKQNALLQQKLEEFSKLRPRVLSIAYRLNSLCSRFPFLVRVMKGLLKTFRLKAINS